jgi:hypothetical protein
VAIREDLELDLRDALRQIDQLERALESSLTDAARQAGTSIRRELQQGESVRLRLPPPTVDTSGITRAIDGAVQAADTSVAPTVDPGSAGVVTSAIDTAVIAADTTVDPSVAPGSAADITSVIDTAVGAASTAIVVSASVSGGDALDAACRDVDCVDKGLQNSTESANGLKGALGGIAAILAAAGVADFFRDSVLAAADLGEAVSKNNVVFADAAGEVESWAETSATSMGLATDEALGYASSLGVLLQSTGNTAEASAEMATTLVGLSGDLASFSNLEGGAQQASEALSAALRGEAEQARALGIILNEEVISRAAVAHGIAAQGEELDAQQRQLAIYQEILRQTELAQGDFARTADSLPNVLRTLSAEYRNVQTAVGNELLPDVVNFTQHIRSEGLPALQELALGVTPALIAAMENLLPLFSAGTQLLLAFAPTIEAVALGLGSIPSPLLLVAGGALLLVRNLELLQKAFLALATNPATLGITALGVAIAGTLAILGQAEQRERDLQRQADELSTAVFGNEAAFTDLTGALEAFVLTSDASALASERMVEALQAAGQTASSVAEDLAGGEGGFGAFLDDLVAVGSISQEVADELVAMGASTVAASRGIGGFAIATADVDDATRELIFSFAQEARALDTASEAQARLLVTSGQVTQQQFDSAEAARTAADGTVDWALAIQDLGVAADEHAQIVARNNALFSEQALSSDAAAEAARQQALAVRELRGELDPLYASTVLTADQMVVLSESLAGGSLSTQEFIALAREFGVTTEELAAAEVVATEQIETSLQAQRDAVQEFRDQLTTQMPEAAQAFSDFNDEATIQEAIDQFIMDTLAFAAAQDTLNTILEGGFDDLATFLATAPPAIIRQFAGLTTAELATFEGQIEAGNDILATGAETAETNAGLLAEAAGGWAATAVTDVEDADLPGAVGGAIEDTGQAAVDAAGSEQGGGTIRDAYLTGVNIGQALKNGLALQEVAVFLAGIRLGDAAIRGINVGAGINSPSIYAMEAGRNIWEGFIGGFEDAVDVTAFERVGAGAVGALSASGFGSVPSVSATGAGTGLEPIEISLWAELDGAPVVQRANAVVAGERRATVRVARAGSRFGGG